jgi:hypothetical protein
VKPADNESAAPFVDRYPSVQSAPQTYRSPSANGKAALALVIAVVVVVALLAIVA